MSTSIKRIAEQASDPKLLLTPKINDYLLRYGTQRTDRAMDMVWKALTTPGRDRSRSFSASAAGTDLRHQELTFLGYPQKPIMPSLNLIFDQGTWQHAEWQSLLISAGLCETIETPLDYPKYNAKGSMDGTGYVAWQPVNKSWEDKEYVIELKTVGAHMWEKMAGKDKPKDDHLKQIHRYFLISGLRLCSYIMIDKGNQGGKGIDGGFKEIVVECDDDLLEESLNELEELNHALRTKTLHPQHPSCRIGTNRMCPFRGATGACKTVTDWVPYQKP